MNSRIEGVEPPTPTEAEARRRYLQWELDRVTPSPYDNIIRVKFFGEENSKHLNITPEQYAAIKKIIVPEDPSPVSHTPCITGKVELEGSVSEFLIPLENDSVGFSQWGAPNEALWERVELLENMSVEAREWWADHRPREEDDGEEGCDDFQPDGSELCSVCNKPYGAHYA